MMMQIVGTFAEFERAMLRERTQSGLDIARTQGRVGGRRPKLKANQSATGDREPGGFWQKVSSRCRSTVQRSPCDCVAPPAA